MDDVEKGAPEVPSPFSSLAHLRDFKKSHVHVELLRKALIIRGCVISRFVKIFFAYVVSRTSSFCKEIFYTPFS